MILQSKFGYFMSIHILNVAFYMYIVSGKELHMYLKTNRQTIQLLDSPWSFQAWGIKIIKFSN